MKANKKLNESVYDNKIATYRTTVADSVDTIFNNKRNSLFENTQTDIFSLERRSNYNVKISRFSKWNINGQRRMFSAVK